MWTTSNAELIGPEFPKDAIHGVQRDIPDVHVYYQWLLNVESGVKYSHYDLLLPANSDSAGDRVIELPKVVPFHDGKEQVKSTSINPFFDPATYRNRTFQFPELKEKLVPSEDPDSFMQPMIGSAMQGFFDLTQYDGKNYKFPPFKGTGRVEAISHLSKDRFQVMFNIPSQPEAPVTSSAANHSVECEPGPQSLEVALLPKDVLDPADLVEKAEKLESASCEEANPAIEALTVPESNPEEERLLRLFQPILQGKISSMDDDESNHDTIHSHGEVLPEQAVLEEDVPQSAAEDMLPAVGAGHDREQAESEALVPVEVSQGIVPRSENQALVPVEDDPEYEAADSSKSLAMRVPNEMLDAMFNSPSTYAVFKWQHKLVANTKICFVGADEAGKVIATARLSGIDTIDSNAGLRLHAVFQDASRLQKDTWRSFVVQERKKLYVWNFRDLKKLDVPLELPPFRGRSLWVALPELKPYVDRRLPGMDLCETCEYFINRLSDNEFEKLGERLRALHGRTVSIGSTCSGSDICVPVMQATLEKLNEVFKVSSQHWLCESKVICFKETF